MPLLVTVVTIEYLILIPWLVFNLIPCAYDHGVSGNKSSTVPTVVISLKSLFFHFLGIIDV